MVTTTFCISGAVLAKAGYGKSSELTTATIGTDLMIDTWIIEAEGVINTATRYNWTSAYASLNDATKKILQDTAGNLAAIYAINYDMGGYTSRGEAEDMINTLSDAAMRNISIIREKETQNFIVNPSTGTV